MKWIFFFFKLESSMKFMKIEVTLAMGGLRSI